VGTRNEKCRQIDEKDSLNPINATIRCGYAGLRNLTQLVRKQVLMKLYVGKTKLVRWVDETVCVGPTNFLRILHEKSSLILRLTSVGFTRTFRTSYETTFVDFITKMR
jgi:hypothetical protein